MNGDQHDYDKDCNEISYRHKELLDALTKYRDTIATISSSRLSLFVAEREALQELQNTLFANHPKLLSKYFDPQV